MPAIPNSRPDVQPVLARTARRAFRCRCGRPVFFGNDSCIACGTPLGYDPTLGLLRPLAPTADPAVWRALRVRGDGQAPLLRYRRCDNAATVVGCNWLVRAEGQAPSGACWCRSCRLDRTVPDPQERDNATLWAAVEQSKRELVAQLIGLGLPVASRVSEDPQGGVMFDLLRSPVEGPRVVTGHADGLITLDIEEANPAHRESMRLRLNEPYRTMLGHLRHEIGHYYWQRLIDGTPWLEHARELFGDERADYAAALETHYATGAPADWNARHVSAYASAHPHEDWAETFAHYLHLTDGLATARAFGLAADRRETAIEPFGLAALDVTGEAGPDDHALLAAINGWVELTVALNQVTRSLGEADFYPFVLSVPAVRKLHFVDRVVKAAAAGGTAGLPASPSAASATGAAPAPEPAPADAPAQPPLPALA